ncbi:hypothetical protein K1W69_24535 [Hoeflea sp. WL0058]|uniref:Bacteriophage tail tape measure C-terminal domain-containing protein n=1 Tax=Flavimaribacter sediminis TaxID=2865987 RepID=A0AAE2ZVD4_9HYPH|nr:hypothetical protein [Flavimaribacter sediminis]MBW8640382.1 hypothetical protein [Flavimaribacter sediminis]
MPDLSWNIRARDRSDAAFNSFDRRVRTSDAGVRRLGVSMNAVGAARTNIAGAAAALAGIGVSAGAVRSVVEDMSRLAKDADKVGLLTDEFQRLQFGFGLAGVEADKFTMAMEQFNKRLTEAQTGTGNLKKILDANNISLFDANGEMKSVNQLLAEYADLIAGAESSQNKLYLATEAFGRSGGDMVLAMRNGAKGVRDLAGEAANAGGVIEEQLLRRAEEFDDDWTRVSRRFEVNMQQAILTVVDAFYEIGDAVDWIEEKLGNLGNASIFEKLGKLVGANQDAVFVPGRGIVTDPDEIKQIQQQQQMAANPLEPFGGAGDYQYDLPRTMIPEPANNNRTGSARSSSGSSASSAQQTIDALTLEIELLGRTQVEQEKLIQLRAAGVDASSEQGQQIIALVDRLEQERQAIAAVAEEQKRLEEQQRAFAGSLQALADYGVQAFEIWQSGAEDMEEQLKRLGVQVVLLAAQALLLGQGPLAGLFGTTGGGLFAGLFAEGGEIPAGQWGIAGEAGEPEIIKGPATVIPMSKLVGPRLQSGAAQRIAVDLNSSIGVSFDSDAGFRSFVKDQAVQTVRSSAPAIIGGSVQQTNKQLPQAMAEKQRRYQ